MHTRWLSELLKLRKNRRASIDFGKPRHRSRKYTHAPRGPVRVFLRDLDTAKKVSISFVAVGNVSDNVIAVSATSGNLSLTALAAYTVGYQVDKATLIADYKAALAEIATLPT